MWGGHLRSNLRTYGSVYMFANHGFEGLVRTLNSFIHRRSNHGGHAGNKAGDRFSLAKSVKKFILRRFAWTYEALSQDKELMEVW